MKQQLFIQNTMEKINFANLHVQTIQQNHLTLLF